MNIFKRMSRTLIEVGPTLRMTLFRDEAAQASARPERLVGWLEESLLSYAGGGFHKDGALTPYGLWAGLVCWARLPAASLRLLMDSF